MLRAYGLVYALLSNNVPVSWVIDPAKSQDGEDFELDSGTLQDVETGASISTPRSYLVVRSSVAASDAAVALPIIQAWQAASGDNTVVHRRTSGSFSANVARTLIRAPRIAVLKDGNEAIAFADLNEAGIPDSASAVWSAASPDLLTEAEVAGPTTSNHADGILFHVSSTLPRYCSLASMHYIVTATTPEVVQEVRSSLAAEAFTHAFMQCDAIRAFENNAAGHFLTTLGLDDDGDAPLSPIVRVPSDPLAQIHDAFEVDMGAVDSIGLAPGSTFRTGVTSSST